MNPFSRSLSVSVLIHLGLYGAALGIIAWGEAHAAFRMDLDQSNVPLLTLAAKVPPPPETWILAKKSKIQVPLATPSPTPDTSTAAVSRLPSWVGGMIDEDDYPTEMRKQKKEGRVIAEILIDIGGNVKSVSIIQGSDPAFDAVVLEKLKDARFRPALDKSGQPMNCRVRVPISFKID